MTLLEKGKFIGTVFTGGVKSQLEQEWTWAAAAVIGLHQGLKYKGSLKTGVAGGLAVLGAISMSNGIYNIVAHWDKIVAAMKQKEE